MNAAEAVAHEVEQIEGMAVAEVVADAEPAGAGRLPRGRIAHASQLAEGRAREEPCAAPVEEPVAAADVRIGAKSWNSCP